MQIKHKTSLEEIDNGSITFETTLIEITVNYV